MKKRLVLSFLLVLSVFGVDASAKKYTQVDLLTYGMVALVGVMAVGSTVGLVLHRGNVKKQINSLDNKTTDLKQCLYQVQKVLTNREDEVGISNRLENLEKKMEKYHGSDESKDCQCETSALDAPDMTAEQSESLIEAELGQDAATKAAATDEINEANDTQEAGPSVSEKAGDDSVLANEKIDLDSYVIIQGKDEGQLKEAEAVAEAALSGESKCCIDQAKATVVQGTANVEGKAEIKPNDELNAILAVSDGSSTNKVEQPVKVEVKQNGQNVSVEALQDWASKVCLYHRELKHEAFPEYEVYEVKGAL